MADFETEIAHISFYLGKKQNTVDSVLDYKTHSLELKNAKITKFKANETNCCFVYFIKKTTKTSPPWLDFINEQLPDEDAVQFQASSQSPNGILFLEIENRILVATFGRSATSYLDRKSLEPDFGIKTAMNLCGNEELRQTKSQSHAITTTHIDRQTNKPVDTFAFGLSEAEDLSYISAHIKDNKNITLQGRNSLTIKIIGEHKLNWERLIDQCTDFLNAYARKDYLDLFPNYKNFEEASEDEATILDQELINALQKSHFTKFGLGIPEFLSDNEYGFSYSNHSRPNNNIYAYLDPTQLSENLTLSDITLAKLKSKQIYAYSYEDDRILSGKKWSVYDCISYETHLNQNYFVLSDGRWLRVDDKFYDNITTFTKNTLHEEPCEAPYANIDISDHSEMQNRESIFNEAVVTLRPSCILFDRAKLRIGLGRKDKEFCDILDMTENNHIRIIHCKPYKDSSSTNYLFSQAKFYCEAFITDQTFLTEIRKHIEDSPCAKKTDYLEYIKEHTAEINGSNYTICLWLLYNKNEKTPSKHDIPLMAQYELMLMHHLLRNTCKFRDIIIRFIPVTKTNYKRTK